MSAGQPFANTADTAQMNGHARHADHPLRLAAANAADRDRRDAARRQRDEAAFAAARRLDPKIAELQRIAFDAGHKVGERKGFTESARWHMFVGACAGCTATTLLFGLGPQLLHAITWATRWLA